MIGGNYRYKSFNHIIHGLRYTVIFIISPFGYYNKNRISSYCMIPICYAYDRISLHHRHHLPCQRTIRFLCSIHPQSQFQSQSHLTLTQSFSHLDHFHVMNNDAFCESHGQL